MAWTHGASAQATGTTSQPTIAKPSGVTVGVFVWATLFTNTVSSQWPAGWTEDGRFIDPAGNLLSWGHHVAGSAEPTSYAWPITCAAWQLMLETFSGQTVNQENAADTFLSVSAAATSTTLALARPVLTVAGDLIVYLAQAGGTPTISFSAGAALLQNLNGAATAWESQAGTGQSAARTATYNTTQVNRSGLTIAYASIAPPTPIAHVVTGSGSFSVANPVAISVSLTGVPASLGQAKGNPTRYYELGSIAFANANGAVRQVFVSQNPELFIAPMSSSTTVYYSFAAGVTATITELATP